MSLAKNEEELEDYGLSSEEIAKDDKSFNDYLLETAKGIPDVWLPHDKRYSSEATNRMYFKEVAPELKIYIKAFALEQLSFIGRELISVNIIILMVYRFLDTVRKGELININYNFENSYEAYVGELRDSVKNIVKNKKAIATSTARAKAVAVLKFIVFLNSYSNKNSWAGSHNATVSLPKKLAKYFNKKELQAFQNELVALQMENKTRSIPWGMMYEIMKFAHALPPSHIKTATVLMAEAGLRISEARQLKIDCLESVSETEQLAVQRYFERLGKSAPVDLDYSESYWLEYYVIKKKGGVLERGTPILVGKSVKKVIDEQIKLTAELREESGSDMLFLNKNSAGEISIRSYTALLKDRDRLIEEGMPFFKFHQLRATFATILHRLGISLDIIQKYMNHISSDITARYVNSDRSKHMNMSNKIFDGNIAGTENNKNFNDFSEALLSAVENSNFTGLSHNSQIKMYKRLMKKYGIKLSSSDHGTCILPEEKVCPSGYEGVNPCHTEECKSFNPDADEESKQFFILSLARAENKEIELKKFADNHGSVQVNFEPIYKAKRSLVNILQQIERI